MSNDKTNTETPDAGKASDRSADGRWLGRIVLILLTVAVVAVSTGVSVYWMKNKPKAHRRSPQSRAALVEVAAISPKTEKVVIHAMGTMIPTRSMQLAARVGGQIVDVDGDFVPGGFFGANERILQIEPKDYELLIKQRAGDLAKAQCDLKVEMGQQSVSQREYELLGQDVVEEDEELLLRRPHLAMAQAAVSAAQASLEQARLDLKRTDVLAPFNARIQSKEVDLGSQVSVGASLASLVGTDEYWVQVSIPVDELQWISIPGPREKKGSPVRIYHESAWGKGVFRTGEVERLMTDLEPEGRMARVLVTVKDPLQLKSPQQPFHPLILNSYVRVEIDGKDLANIVRVPRIALRDGGLVWVVKPDQTLDIREVKIVWGGNDHVYVSEGLAEGDLLITSDLSAPVEGMALRAAESFEADAPRQSLAESPEAKGRPKREERR